MLWDPRAPGAMVREVLDQLLLELCVHSGAQEADARIPAQVAVQCKCTACDHNATTKQPVAEGAQKRRTWPLTCDILVPAILSHGSIRIWNQDPEPLPQASKGQGWYSHHL